MFAKGFVIEDRLKGMTKRHIIVDLSKILNIYADKYHISCIFNVRKIPFERSMHKLNHKIETYFKGRKLLEMLKFQPTRDIDKRDAIFGTVNQIEIIRITSEFNKEPVEENIEQNESEV
jgi:hypothetical protein